jgi:predicted nucleic acid-binding protein
MNSILLDTSFCIRLLKQDDPLHTNAYHYFQYFLESKIEMYLSTIVVSEYSVKDDITNLPLQTFKIIPFDFFDGKVAGEFYSIINNSKEHTKGLERLVIKDDCKLIAQIYNRKIDAYITKDRKSFNQFFYPLQKEMKFSIELLDLSIPLKNYRNELF